MLKQWPMHTLIGKHTHACRILQTHTHPYIHSLQTLADKLRLGQTDKVCTLSHTRRHTVDKTDLYIYYISYIYIILIFTYKSGCSVFIVLINALLASCWLGSLLTLTRLTCAFLKKNPVTIETLSERKFLHPVQTC